jgi:hypothetical protein
LISCCDVAHVELRLLLQRALPTIFLPQRALPTIYRQCHSAHNRLLSAILHNISREDDQLKINRIASSLTPLHSDILNDFAWQATTC